MKVLCTMPGKFGDILWSLPTVRAISEAYRTPVDVATSAAYGAICPLIEQQPYVRVAGPIDEWAVQDTAPMTPRVPALPAGAQHYYDAIYHLGYEGWPLGTLAGDIWARADREWQAPYQEPRPFPALDLGRPWVTIGDASLALIRPVDDIPTVYLGWSEEHFELKVGLSMLLAARCPEVEFLWVRAAEGRYQELPDRRPANLSVITADWLGAASFLFWADLYLGCLSAAWVLANATGTPAIVCEPNPQRHHPVFWQDGKGKNVLVRGIDGQPTFDARHVGDALEVMLAKVATVKEYVRTRERMELGEGE